MAKESVIFVLLNTKIHGFFFPPCTLEYYTVMESLFEGEIKQTDLEIKGR